MPELDIAFSSCPNDTFIFHAMLHGLVDVDTLKYSPRISDVEDLNHRAMKGTHSISKLSFHAYLYLRSSYTILDSGAALGYGCGPLVVASSPMKSLHNKRVAIPGRYTTAHLLLKLWHPGLTDLHIVRFDEILPGIRSGKFDAGVIIHEGRFVYPSYGCTEIVDLGKWWETETGLPIPLGCIAIKNDTSIIGYKEKVETHIRQSIEYAYNNPDASRDYVASLAQEMDDSVIREHINLYVNDFTLSLGETGQKAVTALEEMARCRNILTEN